MANYVFVAKSLDGFIAARNGSTEWLNIPNPQKTDYGYIDFNKKIDTILIGRLSFEKILTYKHYPYHKPVFVLSNTMKNIPINLQDNVTLVKGNLSEIIKDIHKKGYENIYIDGAKTIQSFLKEDLIDEMTISTLPLILGKGISLFSNIGKTIYYKPVETKTYENGVITTIYTKNIQ